MFCYCNAIFCHCKTPASFPPFSHLMVNLNGLSKHALVSPCALQRFVRDQAPPLSTDCHHDKGRHKATCKAPLVRSKMLKALEARWGSQAHCCGSCRGASGMHQLPRAPGQHGANMGRPKWANRQLVGYWWGVGARCIGCKSVVDVYCWHICMHVKKTPCPKT